MYERHWLCVLKAKMGDQNPGPRDGEVCMSKKDAKTPVESE